MSQRSSLGGQLARAMFYSTEEFGRRKKQLERDPDLTWYVVPCKETARHALSGGETDQDSTTFKDGMRQKIAETLTQQEREVLHLQRKLLAFVEQRIRIPAGDLEHHIKTGATLIPASEEIEQRAGLPDITTVLIVERVQVQVDQLTQAEIAERLGITVRQCRRIVQSANRKLRRLQSSLAGF